LELGGAGQPDEDGALEQITLVIGIIRSHIPKCGVELSVVISSVDIYTSSQYQSQHIPTSMSCALCYRE